nr:hypothetical protein [Jiangella anatolica]
MDVLDGQQRRPVAALELRQQGGQQSITVGAALQLGGEVGTHAVDHVPERSERARRHQVVAVADQHPSVGRHPSPHRVDQPRLADPGLAEDQDHMPGAGGRLPHQVGEIDQLTIPLDKSPVHAPMLARRGSRAATDPRAAAEELPIFCPAATGRVSGPGALRTDDGMINELAVL